MDYQTATQYLYSLGHETLAMKLGLENISHLVDKLGKPNESYPSVHIAGTNGKGSFCAMLAAVLAESATPTGLFTSPHLVDLTERFKYNLQDITQEEFSKILSKVKLEIDDSLAKKQMSARPTFFEHVTAIALEYFRQCRVKLAILEVGLGGRLDSTNIVSPILSVITSIDYDHEKYLGNTLSDIAREKAGILKPNTPALIAPQQKEAAQVILEVAKKTKSPLIWLDDKELPATPDKDGYWKIKYLGRDIILGLRGKHQVNTAKLVIKAVEILNTQGFSISLDNIIDGIRKTIWLGRLELIESNPNILFDGAHNPHGVRALREFLKEWLPEKNYSTKVLIFSTMQDKKFLSMAKEIFPFFDLVILVNRSDERAVRFQKIDQEISLLSNEIIIAESTAKALEIATKKASNNGLVTFSGSLYLIGEIKKILKN